MSAGAEPKQLGYMLIQDGSIAKSEGDLVNVERLAAVILRMVAVGPFFTPPATAKTIPPVNTNVDGTKENQFDRLTILFSSHQYDIVVGSGGGGISVTTGRQSQHQKQVIHVVKRTLHLGEEN